MPLQQRQSVKRRPSDPIVLLGACGPARRCRLHTGRPLSLEEAARLRHVGYATLGIATGKYLGCHPSHREH